MLDLEFIKQADTVTLNLEKAKRALEAAKEELDQAKTAYDEVFAQSDEHGIPKAKLRKLTEDRVQAMIDAGLLEMSSGSRSPAAATKIEKPKKTKKREIEEQVVEYDANGDEMEPTVNH